MQYQAHSSYPPCPRLWLLNQLWCTPLRRLSHLLRHPPLHPRGLPLRLHPLHRLHHLHRLCHRHLCPVLHTHLTTFNLHYRWTHRRSLQMSLHHGPQQSKQLPGIALTKDRIDRAGQLRKPLLTLHHRHLRQHRLHPCHLNLHPWVPLHNNWLNLFDLFKLSNY